MRSQEVVIWIWVFPKIGGNPQNGWFIRENPMNKWMIWGFYTPIFGSTPISRGGTRRTFRLPITWVSLDLTMTFGSGDTLQSGCRFTWREIDSHSYNTWLGLPVRKKGNHMIDEWQAGIGNLLNNSRSKYPCILRLMAEILHQLIGSLSHYL